MSVPGEFTTGDLVTAAELNALPGGVLDYAQVTANQTGITTETDLTGLTVTVTVAASRRIRITGSGFTLGTASDDSSRVRIYEDAVEINDQQWNVGSAGEGFIIQAVRAPAAGSVTYKLTMQHSAGSGTDVDLVAATDRPAFILVEDIGPA